MAIQSLEKPVDRRCEHQCRKGCGIYNDRPDECRAFTCLWLMKLVPSWMRPNKTNAVPWYGAVTDEGTGHVLRINFSAAHKRDKRVLEWAESVSHNELVVLTVGDKHEGIRHGSTIAKWRTGQPVKIGVMGRKAITVEVDDRAG